MFYKTEYLRKRGHSPTSKVDDEGYGTYVKDDWQSLLFMAGLKEDEGMLRRVMAAQRQEAEERLKRKSAEQHMSERAKLLALLQDEKRRKFEGKGATMQALFMQIIAKELHREDADFKPALPVAEKALGASLVRRSSLVTIADALEELRGKGRGTEIADLAEKELGALRKYSTDMSRKVALEKEKWVQAMGALAPYMPLLYMVFRRRSNEQLRGRSELEELLPPTEERYGWEERYGCEKMHPIEMHAYTKEFIEDMWSQLLSKKGSNFAGLRCVAVFACPLLSPSHT